jgi:hypothetical protein
MAYVDLNPIRAKMEVTPETSKHTSIQHRIQALIKGEQPKNLMRFVGNHRQDMPKGIAYSLIDYCELVDCTGRCIREDKASYIEQHHSPILARLDLDSEQWLLSLPSSNNTSAPPWAVNTCYNNSNLTQTINVYEGWQRPESYFNTPEQFSITRIQS